VTGRCTVLVLGDSARGDDGAAAAAVARLAPIGRASVRVRHVGQLGPDDLVEALVEGRCVVVDAVRGIDPGSVVELPLRRLAAAGGPQPASSHALPVETVIGLAEALGADLDRGAFVGIGGSLFDLGAGLSPAVEHGLTEAAAAIGRTIDDREVS
jgi:hydrogenase maturation protease